MINSQRTKTNATPLKEVTRPKRQRLVEAACDLFHHNGVARTSLADIAAEADVPLGNVYYYFKSKDALIDAVVDARVSSLADGTAELEETITDPGERLKAWFDQVTTQADSIARYGCPYGTLSTELAKITDPDHRVGTSLLQAPTDWAERQFDAMGRHDAPELALELLMAYQGAAVLAHALSSPDLMHREAHRVHHWIDTLITHDTA